MPKSTDSELRRGTLEMILLTLLSERPMYGYELVSTLEARGGTSFEIKEGTLYPILYRLEKAEWVQARWETLERGVPRKYYHLTPAGREHLTRLVQEWRAYAMTIQRFLGKEEKK